MRREDSIFSACCAVRPKLWVNRIRQYGLSQPSSDEIPKPDPPAKPAKLDDGNSYGPSNPGSGQKPAPRPPANPKPKRVDVESHSSSTGGYFDGPTNPGSGQKPPPKPPAKPKRTTQPSNGTSYLISRHSIPLKTRRRNRCS